MSITTLKLLSDKTSSLELGSASFDSLTQADVAGAMGFVNHEGAELFGHIKFAGHHGMVRKLEALAIDLVTKKARRAGWTSKPDLVAALVRLAIVEKTGEWNCHNCKGTGELFVSKASLKGRPPIGNDMIKATCPACKGTRKTYLTDRKRYRAVGLTRKAWASWDKRYRNDFLPVIDKCEEILQARINYQLKQKKR